MLFLVDYQGCLQGSITDGDMRRGLIAGLDLHSDVSLFSQKNPKYVQQNEYSVHDIVKYRKEDLKIIPVVDSTHRVIDIINFKHQKSYLPVDGVIMAGGVGKRLLPLTEKTPKPLLPVNGKPIISYNTDLLLHYGIKNITITINYLGQQIKNYYSRSGLINNIELNFVEETVPLGTAGSLTLIEKFKNDTVLLMNSDLLTNVDLEDFYLSYIDQSADMSVVTVPYEVNIPYAVVECKDNLVKGFTEKPTVTYYTNAGIYLIKADIINSLLPKFQFFNATDLMDVLIQNGYRLTSYPTRSYWLDVGKHDDYKRAQTDVSNFQINV